MILGAIASCARAAWRHVCTLWGRYWLVPLLPGAYALVLAAFDELRPEHVVFGALCAGIGFIGPRAKRFLVDVSPYIAVAIGYDVVRYLRPFAVTPERVLGCELRQAELLLFRAGPGRTFQDFFATHHAAPFDLLFAVPYTIFVYVVLVYAAYLYFKDRARMRHYLLAFAIGNYVSFACWLLFPAAPPWYLRMHGCAIDTSIAANPAALARVDALLGIDYFATFYGRASTVFGALPSMHCAYPLIGLLTAFRAAGPVARGVHVAYTLVMALAAVYLDHHWMIDVIAGWTVAVVSVALAGAWLRARGVVLDSLLVARPAAVPSALGRVPLVQLEEAPASERPLSAGAR